MISCILLVAVQDVYAGSPHRRGTAGATELLIPVGARGVAISGSNLATTTGLEAIHWNPAGLAGSGLTAELTFSHLDYIADIGVNYLALAGKLGDFGTLGFSMRNLSFGDIEVTTVDNPEGTGATYSPTYLTVGLTFSRAMTDRIYFGTTAKLVHQAVARISSSALAFDFGLQYRAGAAGFRFGIALKNIGTRGKFDGPDFEHQAVAPGQPPGALPQTMVVRSASFDLPTTLEGGIAYQIQFAGANATTLSAAFVNNNYSNDEYRLGLEYSYNSLIFLRGGYTFQTDVPEEFEYIYGPTFGAGIQYKVGELNFAFDYAYRTTKFFSANQWIAVSLGF